MPPIGVRSTMKRTKRFRRSNRLRPGGGLLETVSGLYTFAEVPKRHTFGTVMARRVPLGVLQELIGHSDIATTMRYVDVSEDDKRDAIASVFGALGHNKQATKRRASERLGKRQATKPPAPG